MKILSYSDYKNIKERGDKFGIGVYFETPYTKWYGFQNGKDFTIHGKRIDSLPMFKSETIYYWMNRELL